ncbi:MAG TPA: DUF732 domain-containing protein [Candidatus Dietzia merdigallinarum]|nr:DUF732 domain-containing protein [Candidatus Dietzia merdigallinarum]
MSSRSRMTRSRLVAPGAVAIALAAALAGCGGATVEGEAPEVQAQDSQSTAPTSTPFADEHPVKPSEPVPPPPPQAPPAEPAPGEAVPPPAPEPAPEGEPAPEPAPGEPAPPPPVPGAGDFLGLLDGSGIVMPEGVDPVAVAHESCGRFDGGQQMDEVSGWLGDHAQLDANGQGYFLGMAVMTYCPQNFPKLG